MLKWNLTGGGADVNYALSVPTSQSGAAEWRPVVGRWRPQHCRSFGQGTAAANAPSWAADAVYYQLNIQFFTPEGTFAAAIPHLDYLHEILGITSLVPTPYICHSDSAMQP